MKVYKELLILGIISTIILSSCTVSSTSKVNVNVNGENVVDAKAGFDTSDPNLFSLDVNTTSFSRMDFGRQDGKLVSWYIIGDDDKHLTLFSEKVLDVKPYNSTDKKTEWDKTTLYEYLNTDFVNDYFSSDERKRMVYTNDVDDCLVTMASTNNLIDMYGDIYYVKDGYYGNKDFFAANEKIIAKPAEAAIYNDIYPFNNSEFAEIEQKDIDKRYEFANGAAPYWLLDQSEDGEPYAVTGTGYIAIMEPTQGYVGIRPIIRIKK